jgi:N-acetylglucosaminyldiphosphoundecaprenol N-acetyl-beta-D-mannosaminyltransferase
MTVANYIPAQNVIGFPVTALPFKEQVDVVMGWAKKGLSKVVCVANVHMLTEASWDSNLAHVLNHADMVTPDGMPLVWMVKLLRREQQDRVAGLDLMMAVCHQAIAEDVSVFFLGSEDAVLDRMSARLKRDFPMLKIAGMESLPMISMPVQVDDSVVEMVNESGAGVVFLSLGCPKQEKWMMAYKDRINAVMLGIGGVFPLYAGLHSRAPQFVRSAGLEWLYRLVQEPKRLWGRYSETIPPFLWMAIKQVVSSVGRRESARMFTPVMSRPWLEAAAPTRQVANR